MCIIITYLLSRITGVSMQDDRSRLYIILCSVAALLSAFFIFHEYSRASKAQDEFISVATSSPKDALSVALKKRKEKPTRRTVKGLYLTAHSAGTPRTVDRIIDLIDRTELNSVIIDIKDYTGKILYDSNVALVNELKTERNQIGDVRALIQKLHDKDIYVIARQTVFQDPILAERRPEWAIKSKRGKLWHDKKGLTWVDPTRKEVWEYNVAIAEEAIRLGFDEINFDYVRFPLDGNMNDVIYTNGGKKRYEVMAEFFQFLNTELSDEPAWISIDVFGFAMEKEGDNDMSIGQRLVDAVHDVDYISPMMYPSHYPGGHLGLANPAADPAKVIENGMKKGLPRFKSTRAQVRPWLQAFNMGANYTNASSTLIRAQIDAVEKYSDAGWMLWNASNKYSEVGLRVE